jgi:hypothetical protein
VTELVVAGMASTDWSVMPCVRPFPRHDRGAWPLRLGDSGADPCFDPMLCGSAVRRGFSKLIWELPTLGPGHPSFWSEPAMGQVIENIWGSSLGPPDHPMCHALLGALVVGPNPLRLAFLGQPSSTIG